MRSWHHSSGLFRHRLDKRDQRLYPVDTKSYHRNWLHAGIPTGILLGLHAGVSLAGPQGGDIAAGSGQITRPDASTTRIQQRSDKLIVNWESFNVSAQERVDFLQPSSSAAALNRIWDQNPSHIHGQIRANGKVLLVNPNGVIFGKSAVVKVNSLIASGLNISDADFLSGGKDTFISDGGKGGVVINRGLLEASVGGSVSLLGGGVSNEGRIVATAGEVTLAAGNRMTMDFDGDGLLRFAVTKEVLENTEGLNAAVSNSGKIEAAGGEVLLSGRAARQVFSEVVNNSGVIQASAVEQDGGKIRLVAQGVGSTLVNTGRLEATSKDGQGGYIKISSFGNTLLSVGSVLSAGTILVDAEKQVDLIDTQLTVSNQQRVGEKNKKLIGGSIAVTGAEVSLSGNTVLAASGDSGGGTISVGGGYQGMDTLLRNSRSTKVGAAVRLVADGIDGDGGQVVVWSDGDTDFRGAINARARVAGDGGLAEISGKEYLHLGSTDVDLRGAAGGKSGTLLLDPDNIVIVDDKGNANLDGDGNKGDDVTKDIAATDNAGKTSVISNDAIVTLLETADLSLAATKTISVNAAISVSSNTFNLSLAANTININQAIGVGGSLVLSANSTINTGVTINAGRDVDITANTIMASGTINAGQDMKMDANTINSSGTLTAGRDVNMTGDTIGLSANITKSRNVNITAKNVINFSGAITANDNVNMTAKNTFNASGRITANGNVNMIANRITASGAITANGSLTLTSNNNIRLSGTMSTKGAQTYDGQVILTRDTTLTAKNGSTLSNITFTNDVVSNPDNAANYDLTIDGNLITRSGVGLGTPVTSKARANTYLGVLNVAGFTQLHGNISTTGIQTYAKEVQLFSDVTLSANSGSILRNVNFNGDVFSNAGNSNNYDLTIDGNLLTAADVELGAEVPLGGLGSREDTFLGKLSVTGTSSLSANVLTGTSTQTYDGKVTLQGDVFFRGQSGTFSDGIDGGGKTLGLYFSADTILNSALVSQFENIGSLTVAGGGNTIISTNITTTGTQQYDDFVILRAAVSLTGTSVTFNEDVVSDPDNATNYQLNVGGNLITGAGAELGETASTARANTRLLTLAVTGTSSLSANVTTRNTQIYGGRVTLQEDISFRGRIIGRTSVAFRGGIDGGNNALGLLFSGDTTLNSTNFENIGSLTVAGGGNTSINTNITTTGAQQYDDLVILLANTTLTAKDGSTLSSVTFNNDVVSNTTNATNYNLTVDGNLVTGSGAELGAMIAGSTRANTYLGVLSVVGNSGLQANISTTDTQTYDGQVALLSDITLFANASGTLQDITFKGDVVSNTENADNYDLTIDGNLATTTGAELGALVAGKTRANTYLDDLSVTGTGSLSANITTSAAGIQTYDGKVTLQEGVFFHGRSGTFSGGIDGGGNTLGLYFSGDTTLDSALVGSFENIGSLTVAGGGNTNVSADITTTGAQQYDDLLILRSNVTLTAKDGSTLSSVTFNGDVVSNPVNLNNYDLTIDGNLITNAELGALVSGSTRANTYLADLSVSGGSTLSGSGLSTSGTQTYDGRVILEREFVFFANNSGSLQAVTFNGDVVSDPDSAGIFNLNIDGNLVTGTDAELGAEVVGSPHANTWLSSLSVSGTSRLAANVTTTSMGASVFTPGTQTYTGKVTLLGDVSFTGNSGIFTGGLDGGGNALGLLFAADTILDATSLAVFENIGSLTTGGGGNTIIGTDITTTGAQQYDDLVILTKDVTLTAKDGSTLSSITFNGDVVSDTRNSDNYNVTLDGNLVTGSGAELGAMIAATGRANTYLGDVSVTGESDLQNNVFATGTQTYDGQVELLADLTLFANASGTLQSVTFKGDVVSNTENADNYDLTVDGNLVTTTGVELSAEVGGKDRANTRLANVNISGTSSLSENVTTSGSQTWTGKVTLTEAVIFSGTDGTFSGGLDGGGNVVSLLFSGDTTLNGTLENISNLTVAGGGNAMISTDITTTGVQQYDDLVILGADVTLTAKNGTTLTSVTFNGDVISNPDNSDNYDLTVDGNLVTGSGAELGVMIAGKTRANTLLADLSVIGSSSLSANVATSTTSTQTYDGKVSLQGDVTFSGNSGTFSGGLDGGGNALGLFFSADTTLDTNIQNISSLSVAGGGNTFLSSDITTTGTQQYDDLVILTVDVTLIAKDGSTLSSVTFNGDVVSSPDNSNNYNLTIDGNLVTGSGAELGAMIAGSTRANTYLGVLSVVGNSGLQANISTTDTQTYDGQVALLSDITLFANASGTLQDITFKGDVVSNTENADNYDLTIDGNLATTTGAELGTINGAADANTYLGDVSVTGSSRLSANVTSSGSQTWDGKVTLLADVSFAGTSGTFAGGVDGGGNTLGLLFSGDTILDSTLVAGFENIRSLTVGGGGNTLISTDITTTGAQQYDDLVILRSNVTLTAKDGSTLSSVTFNGDVVSNTENTDNYDLIVDGNLVTGGGAELGAMIVGTTRTNTYLGALNVTGNTQLQENISTTGTQTYDGQVELLSDLTLFANASGTLQDITFKGDVVSNTGNADNYDLTVVGNLVTTTGAELGTINAAADANTHLGDLRVIGSSQLSANVTTSTTGTQIYDGKVSLQADVSFRGLSGTFSGGVDGGGNALSLLFSGDTTLDSTVTGSFENIGNFTVGGGGNTFLSTDITTTGTQQYDDLVILRADVTLTANNSGTVQSVTFNGDVVSNTENADNYDLTVAGNLAIGSGAELGAEVAGTTRGNTYLGDLSVTGTSNLQNNVSTTGTQIYDKQVALLADTILAANAGGTLQDVTFKDDVISNADNSSNYDLTVEGNLVTDSGADLGAAVAGKARANTWLASLSVTGSSQLSANITTSAADTASAATGSQTYDGQVTLQEDVTFQGVSGTFRGITGNGKDAELSFTANTLLRGSISGIDDLTVSGGGVIRLETDIETSGKQSYQGDVLLLGENASGERSRTLRGQQVDFAGAVVSGETTGDRHTLVVTGEMNVLAGGELGGGRAVASPALQSLMVSGNSTLAGNVSTVQGQQWMGAVSLQRNVQLSSTDSETIQIVAGVYSNPQDNSQYALQINGRLDLDGEAGGQVSAADAANTRLASLTVTGASELSGDITTVGNQVYGGRIFLTKDIVLTGATPTFSQFGVWGNGAPRPGENLDTATTRTGGESHDLTAIFSGTARLDSAFRFIDNLNVGGAGGTTQLQGSIETIGNQNYQDAVRLLSDLRFSAADGSGQVRFMNTVDSVVGQCHSVLVTGDLYTQGIWGGNEVLSDLRVTGKSFLDGGVNTSGMQLYEEEVTLTGDVTLQVRPKGSAAGVYGDVVFQSAVNSAAGSSHSLTLQANLKPGENAPLGTSQALGNFTVFGEAELRNNIITTGIQEYQRRVTLYSDVRLQGESVLFREMVEGRPQSTTSASVDELNGDVRAVFNPDEGALLTVAAANTVLFSDDVSVRRLDLSASGRMQVAGNVTLHMASPQILLPPAITGEEGTSLTIAGVREEDLTVGTGGLVVTDASGFDGHLVIGGRLQPEGIDPFYNEGIMDVVIHASRLNIEQEVSSGGTITFLGGDIFLVGEPNLRSNSQLGFFASGSEFDNPDTPNFREGIAGAEGRFDATGVTNEVTLTATGGSNMPGVVIIAPGGLADTSRVVLDLRGREVDVAVASGVDSGIQFSLRSTAVDNTTDPFFESFISNFLSLFGLELDSAQTFSINPASSLVAVSEIAYVDVGVLEKELTLFGQIGTGIALALELCEELEGCAVALSEEEQQALIVELRERLEVLRNADNPDEELLAEYEETLLAYEKNLADIVALREEEERAEQEAFDELMASQDVMEMSAEDLRKRELVVGDLSTILDTIFTRIAWLEELKLQPELRAELSEQTGIELTLEVLDEIITATRAEYEFFTERVRLVLDGSLEIDSYVAGRLDSASSGEESNIPDAEEESQTPDEIDTGTEPTDPSAATDAVEEEDDADGDKNAVSSISTASPVVYSVDEAASMLATSSLTVAEVAIVMSPDPLRTHSESAAFSALVAASTGDSVWFAGTAGETESAAAEMTLWPPIFARV